MKRNAIFIRAFTCIISMLIIIGALPVMSASAEITSDGIIYSINSGKANISGYEGNPTSLSIPDAIDGYPVTSIGSYAFYGCESLTNISIPESVTSIGEFAFDDTAYYNDENNWEGDLLYIDSCLVGSKNTISGDCIIKNGTTVIAERIFYEREYLERIVIPEGIKSIDSDAFFNCGALESITIPESVTSIGSGSFYNCRSLKSITIPKGVTSIGSEAFKSCDNLASISIPESVTSIGEFAFDDTAYYNDENNWEGDLLYIDSCLVGSKNTIRGDCIIKNGTTVIAGKVFFFREYLASITIPKSVINIGEDVFYYCTNLQNVYVDPDNTAYCSIDGVLFNKDKTELVMYPMDKDDISYSIPSGVTSIGERMFWKCTELESITIPESVTSIGEYAFQDCENLKCVYISDIEAWCNISFAGPTSNPLYFAENLYLKNELVTDLLIPDGVTSLGNYLFYNNTSLVSISIPDSITSIGDAAFSGCTALECIEIPGGVTSISSYAFDDCTALKCITIPESVTYIGDGAFGSCTALESITIPESVTYIGDGAFGSCTALESITIPESVTSIGEYAFGSCTALEKITIPDGVTSIGWRAFYNTAYYNNYANWENSVLYIGPALIEAKESISSNYTIKDGTTVIAYKAFSSIPKNVHGAGTGYYGCTNLESITIPPSVISIGVGAFFDCWNLKSVYISDIEAWCNISFADPKFPIYSNPLYFAENLYLNNELVTDLVIPDGVTSIDNYLFCNSASLESISIPESVTSIGEKAFYGCFFLNDVYYNGTRAMWDEIAVSDGNYPLLSANIHCIDDTTDHTEPGISDPTAPTVSETTEPSTAPVDKYEAGDVNLDGALNIKDATQIQKHLASLLTLDSEAITLADYDGDTKITIKDATAIQKMIAGLI